MALFVIFTAESMLLMEHDVEQTCRGNTYVLDHMQMQGLSTVNVIDAFCITLQWCGTSSSAGKLNRGQNCPGSQIHELPAIFITWRRNLNMSRRYWHGYLYHIKILVRLQSNDLLKIYKIYIGQCLSRSIAVPKASEGKKNWRRSIAHTNLA